MKLNYIRGSTVCKDSKKKSRAAIDKVWQVSEKVVQKWLNTRPEKVKIQILMKSQEIANKFYIRGSKRAQVQKYWKKSPKSALRIGKKLSFYITQLSKFY